MSNRETDKDSSPPRRRNDKDSSPPRRRNDNKDSSPPRRNDNNRDASPPRRRNDNNRDASPPRRRNDNNNNNKDSSPPRKRNDNRDSSPPRRNTQNDDKHDKKRAKTASGLTAGLVSKEDIAEEAREIKRRREMENADIDPSLLGEGQETTYRDKRGRKLDMLNEFMRQQALREGKEIKIEKAQYEWGKGAVQKEDEKAARRELELIADEPFARSVNDPRLDAVKKQIIHDDDPMAEFFRAKQEKELDEHYKKAGPSDNLKPRKPVYKGPRPPPNRFNILPGFRWDAVDRGNGFEAELLKTLSSKVGSKEDAHKWSSADM